MDKSIQDTLLTKPKTKAETIFSALAIGLLSLQILSVSAYSIIAPFLPLEFQRKEIPEEVSGYIFGMFSLMVIVASPFISGIIQRFGRRKIMFTACATMGLSIQAYGIITPIQKKQTFVSLSFLSRIVQGLSSVAIQVTVYSIGANFFPDQKEFMIGMLEAAAGLGMMVGPLFGTFLFSIGGYNFMYYSFGSIFYILAVAMYFYLPRSLDMYTSQEEKSPYGSEEPIQAEQQCKVTIMSMFKTPNYTIASLIGCMGYFYYDFLNPILALRLSELGLSQSNIGLFFSIYAVVYMVSCVLIPFLPKIVKKNVWILFGILASSFALFLLGPSQILYFPKDSVILIAVGFALIGLFDPFILVFVLPEMIEVIEKKHPELTERQKAHLTDITTGLLTSILGIGQMLGPIYSAYFAKIFGFRLTCDVVAVVCLLLTILQLTMTDVLSSIKCTKKI